MSLKPRVKSLEGRIVRLRPVGVRSPEDVLAGLRIAGIPRIVAQARCLLRLELNAHDPQVSKGLRDSCRDMMLRIGEAMRRGIDWDPDLGGYQDETDAALAAVETVKSMRG